MHEPLVDRFPKKVLAGIGIERMFIVSRLVIAAERLQIFRVLHARPLATAAIGRACNIDRRYLDAFLTALLAIGLLRKRGDKYRNTALAEKYFIAERSIYWTRRYSSECVESYEQLTDLETMLTSGKSHAELHPSPRVSYTEAMKQDRRQAEDFTQMLFHLHRRDAEALAKYLDLSDRHALLDVGGGSGVMSIALAKKNSHLRACILDIAPVCEIAAKNARRAGVSRQITTLEGDIRQTLPAGHDVVMFCDVGQLPSQMLTNAYNALPANGLVVVVDRYLSKDRVHPLDRLVGQFVGSGFELATGPEMAARVKSCGFRAVTANTILGDLWVITGAKPSAGKARARKPA